MRTRRLLPLLASAVVLLACPAAASAGVTEFTSGLMPGGEPADITTGPDGNLWFTQEQGAIGSITPTGAITEYLAGLTPGLPLGRSPRQITAGPDGALWFTVQGNKDAIARLDPATGTVKEFQLPSSREPTGIAAGPDGNLWFTERGARKIGRITTDGQIDEFSAGLNSKDLVNDIAAGHDGKLWFTVEADDDDDDDDDDDARSRTARGPKIGRIDPSTGIVTHFNNGLTGATPNQIVSASDGKLYFTDSSTPGAIRRISTNGSIKTYRTGLTAGSQPTGIAEGGDGALWFTAGADPGRLGRLWRATSTITQFAGGSLPNFTADAHPRGITRGPDGNVWFTERDYPGRIGRMTVPPLADLEIETLPGSSAKHETAAVLQATIAANSQATTFHLEYGSDEDYGSTTAEQAAGAGAAPVQRVVDLPLTPGSHVHVRVVATNGSGESASDDVALWVGANGEILASAPAAPGPVTSNAPATATPGVPSLPTVGPGTGAVEPPAPPTLGQGVVLRPVSGVVRFKAPGASGYTALGSGAHVPVGSLIDTRNGRVSLQSARNARGRTQTGTFWGALFQVRQRRHGRGVTDLVLRGGRFKRCGTVAGASVLAREAGGKRRVVRRLWGKDRHARFRTHGRDSVATVRGTRWVTTDRCDGTLTKVSEGKVLVRDLHRKRNVLLTAGHAYLARHRR